MAKQAQEHLKDYGFVEGPDGLVKASIRGNRPKTRFVPVDGGFLRYEREDGVWRQYPFSIHSDWQLGGLAFDVKQAAEDPNAKVKPECFDWVYPESEITKIYSHAVQVMAAEDAESKKRKNG